MSVQKQSSESQQPVSMEPDKSASSPETNPARKRKRHISALTAAAQYRSPTGAVGAHSYFDTGMESTGINIGFREQGGID